MRQLPDRPHSSCDVLRAATAVTNAPELCTIEVLATLKSCLTCVPYLPCSGTLSDASRVAKLGGGDLTAAQQQLQERQAAGAHASTSGQDEAGWGDQGVGGQMLSSMRGPGAGGSGQIELPSMPWSDWEVPADQITICKREDGSDWELGSGAFGKVCHAPPSCVLHHSVQFVAAVPSCYLSIHLSGLLELPWPNCACICNIARIAWNEGSEA